MIHSEITFRPGPPAANDYQRLFETTGWNQQYRANRKELYQSITNSWHVLSAYHKDELVGFGRVVSDGILYALICDLIVTPAYQRQGIGSTLLQKLIDRCHLQKIRVIWLFSAKGKSAFYKNFGFLERPADAPGMQLLTPPNH
jgi:GNAT superfamily N-acetyltransferase